MDVLNQLWERATATHAPLDLPVVLALAGVALVLTWSPPGYRLVRHLVTLIHEAGHALVAVLAGRRLSGIRLHSDTSGVTLSRGKPRGLGMVFTLAAGYPAPALIGLGGAWLMGAGYAAGWLWLLVLICASMLLLVRNLYGLWVVLVTGVAVGALSWLAPPQVLVAAAYLVVFCLLLAAPRSVVEMQRQRRRVLRPGGRGGRRANARPVSDADQLARLTPLPVWCWTAAFWLSCLACLGAGAWVLWSPGGRL